MIVTDPSCCPTNSTVNREIWVGWARFNLPRDTV